MKTHRMTLLACVLILTALIPSLAAAQTASQAAAIAATQQAPQAAPTPAAPLQWIDASARPAAPAPAPVTGFPAPPVPQPAPVGDQPVGNGPASYTIAPPPGQTGQATQTSGSQPGQGQATLIAPPPLIEQAKQIVSPFTGSEIRELRADYGETQKAMSDRQVTMVPKISSITVDMSPGGAPPVLRTMINEASSLVFLDSTGAPWPLAATPRVGSDAFEVQWLDKTPNVVITPHTNYNSTNLTAYLEGLPTPVIVRLVTGEGDSTSKTRVVDYRLDLHIPGRGPYAKSSVGGSSRIGMYNDALQAFLDGVPPADARRVTVDGEKPAQTDIWQLGDSVYVRTPLESRSAYEQTMSSADGMHVYQLAPTPIIALSQGGQSVSISLELE